ncbi:hypothetical protein C7212DRAFT_344190 [Tuber magnatum]|uniref:Uncharacterized protein n=1 Tax=Tuber magnatum TaxID=42249 RepID=A0A317SSI5_9PEZI|nr:hypothetical protein C7212DRAFT_344190 [Tuber magnatum]
MAEKRFRAMGPRELMCFLNSTPLDSHSIETRSGVNSGESQDEVSHLPLTMVETYDNLLRSLTTLFPPSEGTERDIIMSTFEGDLISSPEEYTAVLEPGLHIIFDYPPTVEELSTNFGTLWETPPPKTLSTPNPSDPTPMESDIVNTYLNFASPTLIPSANLKKYELQPPEIHFHVPTPTSISITLVNASFPTDCSYLLKDPEDVPLAGPSAPKAFRYAPDKSTESAPAPDFTPTGEDAYAPLPPWSPFPLYKAPSGTGSGGTDPPNQHVWERRPDGKYKVFSGGTFAMTSFDVFAQTKRQRVACSLSREVEVSPDGTIKDLVSGEEMQTLSWHSTDDQLAPPPGTTQRKKTSEKKVYVNYAEPVGGGSGRRGEWEEDEREIGKDGWWMVTPRRLPLSFSGKQEGKRTFIVGSAEEGVELLQAFMTRCGVGEDIIRSYTTHWAPKLTLNPPLRHTPSTLTNHTSTMNLYMCLIHPKSLLIKFLYPRELRTLLPLRITPEPHRTVRIFAIFRAVDEEEMETEDIAPGADFETEVEKVLGGMGSCGGGWNCGHRGFKVAEVGGIRVFGPPDGTGEGEEEEEGTVIGVSLPGADGDGGWGDVADLDALMVGDEGMRGIRREGYSSGEDTI